MAVSDSASAASHTGMSDPVLSVGTTATLATNCANMIGEDNDGKEVP